MMGNSNELLQSLVSAESEIMEDMPHPHHHEDEWWNKLYRGVSFIDDVNGGQELQWDLVVAASGRGNQTDHQ